MMSININSFMLVLRKIAEIDTFNDLWNSGGIKVKPKQLKAMKCYETHCYMGGGRNIEQKQRDRPKTCKI